MHANTHMPTLVSKVMSIMNKMLINVLLMNVSGGDGLPLNNKKISKKINNVFLLVYQCYFYLSQSENTDPLGVHTILTV